MNRLNASHVRQGRPLPWDVFDAQNNLLLSRGYVIESQHQLDGLLERGMYVSEEDFAAVLATPQAPQESERFNPFWLWDDISSKVSHFLKYAATEPMLEDKFSGISLLVTTLVDNDADAALASILLKDSSRYAFAHSVHVAVLAAILSRRFGWPEATRRDVVRAALTMNIAMLDLQTELLLQKEPLTEDQRREVDTHAERGSLFLRAQGISSPNWLEAVRLHHQRIAMAAEGHRASGRVLSQLLRVLDVFCAKISPRSYRRAIQPPVAAREIYMQEREGCAELVDALIKEIGLYMPGTFVKLENGETALVVKRGVTVSTPKVIALSRGDGMPYIDGLRRDTARPEYAVKTAVPPEKILHRLNLSKIWGY
ncbi:MAG: hypothetical protein BWY57_02184 [Betaproteobacteria bacterium ADurb.Bin341]|nr:MAG: hypothetical protein BWY57_02184 [Betaproteobacteria bacterium ADurb.Bin341]